MCRLRRPSIVVALAAVAALLLGACGWGGDEAAATGTRPQPSTTTTTATSTADPPTTTTEPPTTTATTEPPAPPATTEPPAPSDPDPSSVVCIGDSVMLGAGPQYSGALGMCGTVDATVSRQFSAAPGLAAQYAASGPARVVLHLGTNGTVSGSDVDAALSALSGVPRVLVVNVQLHGGRSWEGQANQALAAGASAHANVVLVDWKGASSGRGEYFAGDGIHLTSAGAVAYASLISASL